MPAHSVKSLDGHAYCYKKAGHHGNPRPKAPAGTKYCRRCNSFKPYADFPPNKAMKLGLGCYCRSCAIALGRERYVRNRPEALESARRWYRDAGAGAHMRHRQACRRNVDRLRSQVWDHYGWACKCCGEDNPAFFTLDHINNDGAAERKVLAVNGGVEFYRILRRRGFPPGYQTLCHNCNTAKGRFGECPHQTQAKLFLVRATA